MAKEKKTAIIIDGKEYFYEDLTAKQQIIVNHISDLQRKIQSSQFNLEQLSFSKDSFINALKEALNEEESKTEVIGNAEVVKTE